MQVCVCGYVWTSKELSQHNKNLTFLLAIWDVNHKVKIFCQPNNWALSQLQWGFCVVTLFFITQVSIALVQGQVRLKVMCLKFDSDELDKFSCWVEKRQTPILFLSNIP